MNRMVPQREIIMVVDDSIIDLLIVEAAIGDQYKVYTVTSAEALFPMLEKVIPEIILMDINMPEIDGYDALKLLQNDLRYCDIPVIFVTADDSVETAIKALEFGALDIIRKPINVELFLAHINARITLSRRQEELRKINEEISRKLNHASMRISRLQTAIITIVVGLIEHKDLITGKHVFNMQSYLECMLNTMIEYPEYHNLVIKWDFETAILSTQLHDIGKIGIPEDILNKPGRLTKEEFEKIKEHVNMGIDLVDHMIRITEDSDFLHQARDFVAYHHEWWDGSGYPYGLAGEEIPLEGRILAILDTYDALTSRRSYKEALSHQESIQIINNESGTHFDPKLVKIFNLIEDKIYQILQSSL